MNYFEKLGNILKIGKNGTFGQTGQGTVLAPTDDQEEVGTQVPLRPEDDPQIKSEPTRKPYLQQAQELVGSKPELSSSDKLVRGVQILGAGLGRGGRDRVSKLQDDFKTKDNEGFAKSQATLKIANDIATLEENQIKTDKLRSEVANEEAYNLAAKDINSDVTKLARSFASDAVENAPIGKAAKEQLLQFVNGANAEQITRNKVLSQLGASVAINKDSIESAAKLAAEKRADAKDSREAQKLPYEIKSEEALASQRNAAANASSTKNANIQNLTIGEKKRDEQFGRDRDKVYGTAIQGQEADGRDIDQLVKIVSSSAFKPDDLAVIADAYAASKDNFGLFATALTKSALSPAAQEFASIIARMAPNQRTAGSGSTSNVDLAGYLKGLGAGITDKNALLSRIGAAQKNNSARLTENRSKVDYYDTNGTLKGYKFSPEEKSSGEKYSVEEVKDDAPKKKSKYVIEEVE